LKLSLQNNLWGSRAVSEAITDLFTPSISPMVQETVELESQRKYVCIGLCNACYHVYTITHQNHFFCVLNSPKDILTVFQMNLLLEADRIDDKLKDCSLLSESVFATSNSEKLKGFQASSRTESELTNDTPDTVSDVIDASIDGTYSIDELTFHSDTSISSPTVPDDRTMPNKRMWSSDQNLPESDSMDSEINDKVKYSFRSKSFNQIQTQCTPDEVTSGSSNQSLNQNHEHKKKTSFKTRVYSNNKRVGSRCYARWPGNGSFFWGFITKAIGYGPHRKYSVRSLEFAIV
jgi:hypothetical protein